MATHRAGADLAVSFGVLQRDLQLPARLGNDGTEASVSDALVTLGPGAEGTIVVCDGAGTVRDEGAASVVACAD